MDPPCTSGMCDCNWDNGFYKDRFSRCRPYRKLELGDRCIVPDMSTQLSPLYFNNEDWDDSMECVANTGSLGYAGYNYGTIKCKLPLIEDLDGNCVANDNDRWPWRVLLGYDADCSCGNNLPIRECDASRGLSCISGKCQCGTGAVAGSCSINFGGCRTSNPSRTTNTWDGNQCRPVRVADTCTSNSDCCGGICDANGRCGCANGFTPVSYQVLSGMGNNGGNNVIPSRIASRTQCFQNYTVVGKGSPCDLRPGAWDCNTNKKSCFDQTWRVTQLCGVGLVCKRCPIDPEPFDQSMGLCRSVNVNALPETHTVPANIDPITGALIPPPAIVPAINNNPYGYGGYGCGASAIAPSVALLLALVAYLL